MNPRTSLPQILGTLRVTLHVVFVALALFALVRVVGDMVAGGQDGGTGTGTGTLRGCAAVAVILLLVVVYTAGTVTALPRRWSPWWLAVLLMAWTVATALSHHAVWLLFPLAFLILAVLDGRPEGHYTVQVTVQAAVLTAAWAVGAFVPMLTGQGGGVAAVVGPGVGVLFAAGAYLTYRLLAEEAERQLATVRELHRTRDRLLAAEKDAGRLEERERISRDIHDTLAQGFNAVVLLSRAASTAVRQDRTQDALGQLSLIEDTAADNLGEARNLICDLAAGGRVRDTSTVLRRIVDDVVARQRALGAVLDVELVVPDEFGSAAGLPLSVQDAVVHIVRESLTNVVRHADATRVRVELGRAGDRLTLSVQDDGRGCTDAPDAPEGLEDATYPPQDGGFGLVGMRLRAADLGGRLEVTAAPGEGTRVCVDLPADLPADLSDVEAGR